MKILPAIDIMAGQCVRLTKGEFSTKKVYSTDVLAMAKKFQDLGAPIIHVVDLEAAKTGQPVNFELITKIIKVAKVPVQVGGGIRSLKTAKLYFRVGAQRIVVSTEAVNDRNFIVDLIKQFGRQRVVIAVESKKRKVVVEGWQKTSGKNYLDFAKELKFLGVTEVLFTDTGRDGSLTEPNYGAIGKLVELGFNVIASGGVATLEAIEKLKQLGVTGAVVGKAVYENRLNLIQAIKAAKPKSNLSKRIIPCLDVKNGVVVKGVRFGNHKVVGKIIDCARSYSEQGADELVFYDITASPEARTVSIDWVRQVAKVINIPFCVAGGIASVKDAREILQNGADKVSINSPALKTPMLINELVSEFGSQCVVVGIDSFGQNGEYFAKQYTGDPKKTKLTKWKTLDWAKEAQRRGAGEIVLNSMSQDGVRQGYDVKQLKEMSAAIDIPVIASGGAGSLKDFRDVFVKTDVQGALAASVFHSGNMRIKILKKYLSINNIPIRP